ncbi:hypothetical protein CPC08DRAFT_814708 [Agrocybe pediades]|nr:hypothetical protein CPC08DRAFT_814708 [Agrocybe pediades]
MTPPSPKKELTEEQQGKWISKTLANSLPGRIVRSSYETFRSSGANVICLSPWGDSSPLVLPCIRFRDVAIHAVSTATHGATSVITAPIMNHLADVVVGSLMDTIIVELIDQGIQSVADVVADSVSAWLEDTIEQAIPIHSQRLVTTATTDLKITLRYKHASTDAALGFFRSSIHKDLSITTSFKDYLSIEKGWFSPYLFASGRRPIIARCLKPDVIYCHGPFSAGDYKIGFAIVKNSTSVLSLVKYADDDKDVLDKPSEAATDDDPEKVDPEQAAEEKLAALPELSREGANQPGEEDDSDPSSGKGSTIRGGFTKMKESAVTTWEEVDGKIKEKSKDAFEGMYKIKQKMMSKLFDRGKARSLAEPPRKRAPGPQMVMVVVGLKPYRNMWNQSARPNESVLHYVLLNGCPTVAIPVKAGAPLVAWDTLTLEHLWKVDLPPEDGAMSETGKFEGIVGVLLEYIDFCVDWDRMITPELHSDSKTGPHYPSTPQAVLRHAVTLLVAAAIRSKDSKPVNKNVDPKRCGIAFWRLP